MEKQSAVSEQQSALDEFMTVVQSMADEFLGWDRYEAYRTSRDKALADIAALRTRLADAEMALAEARELLEQFTPDGKYGDGTQAHKTVWDYARDSQINKLAALLAQPAAASETGSEEADRLCVNCGEPMKNHVGGAKRGLCKNGEWNSWGNSDATQPA